MLHATDNSRLWKVSNKHLNTIHGLGIRSVVAHGWSIRPTKPSLTETHVQDTEATDEAADEAADTEAAVKAEATTEVAAAVTAIIQEAELYGHVMTVAEAVWRHEMQCYLFAGNSGEFAILV